MPRVLAGLALVLIAWPAWADPPPVLVLRTGVWSDGHLSIDVTIQHPPPEWNDRPLTLGGPGRAWSEAVSVTVTSATGVVQKWPLQRVKNAARPQVQIRGAITAGVQFSLTAAQLQALPRGAYEVGATLDLTDAKGGDFQGVVKATPLELDLPAAKPDWAPARLPATVAALTTALETESLRLRRRELALGLEGLLLEAPLLPAGPALDAVVKAHLDELTRQMCSAEELYASDEESGRPSNSFLFKPRLLISPGPLSPRFTGRLEGTAKGGFGLQVAVELAAAPDAAAFWTWIHEQKQPGLHVFPVHVRDGVARVATTVVPAGGPPERFVFISYWKQDRGWKRVSFEPITTDAREWRSNVHRSGPPARLSQDLTDTERAQWLEAQLDLLELTTQSQAETKRGDAVLSGIDEGYVPLLQKRVGQGSVTSQAAALLRLAALKGDPPVETLVDLITRVSVAEQRGQLVDQLWKQLEPRFKSARLAGPDEHPGIDAQSVKLADDFALLELRGHSGGSRTLFRKVAGRFEKLAVVSSWEY
jgi:hypothetical protein